MPTRMALVILVALLAVVCAPSTHAPSATVYVIDLVILDQDGFPIAGVAIFDDLGGVHVAVSGGLRLTVSGPVFLSAYKPGFAPSRRELFTPGWREIVLLPMGRVN